MFTASSRRCRHSALTSFAAAGQELEEFFVLAVALDLSALLVGLVDATHAANATSPSTKQPFRRFLDEDFASRKNYRRNVT